MNNDNKMGAFIYTLRKKKGLTQKQLAEKLSVTDKAISKWERGLGYPDIMILSALAESLGVTTNELLNGKGEETALEEPEKEPEIIIRNTIEYADKVSKKKRTGVASKVIIVLSAVFLLAIVICGICDLATSGTFSWTIYPLSALVFCWLIIVPLIYFKEDRLLKSLIALSVFIFPFLLIILINAGTVEWFVPLVLPIVFMSLIYLWISWYLYYRSSINNWFAGAACLVLAVPLELGINGLVAKALEESFVKNMEWINILALLACAALLLLMGLMIKNKDKD
ncbi:MAG: helix-turn-helix domain-containing protein [Eubacterium sp.]